MLTLVMSLAAPSFADSLDDTINNSEAVQQTEGFVTAKSNICEVSADSQGRNGFDIDGVTNGNYLCNGDFVGRIWFGLVGTAGVKEIAAGLGFTDVMEGSRAIRSILSTVNKIFMAMFAICSSIAVGMFMMGYTKGELTNEHAHRAENLLWSIGMLMFALPLTNFVLVWVTAFTNQGGLYYIKDLKTNFKETGMLSSESRFAIDTDLNARIRIEASQIQTARALVQKNLLTLGLVQSGAWGWTGAEITKDQVIPEMIKQSTYLIKPDKSNSVNIDLHPEALKTININRTVNKYDVLKVADYSDKQKEVWGYPSKIATFIINNNASNFEALAGESMNDGNFITQMNALNTNFGEQNKGRFISDVRALQQKLIAQMSEQNGSFNSSEDIQMPELQEAIQTDVTNVVHQYLNIEDLDMRNSSSIPQAYQFAYSKALTSMMGDDKTGETIREQLDFVGKEIIEANINEQCTKAWQDNTSARALAQIFNGMAPSNGVYNDLIKSGKYDALQSSLPMACLKLDGEQNVIGYYGSKDEADEVKYKIQQLAAYKAYQTVAQNYLLGVKKALAAEQSGTDSLWYNLVIISQQGFVGSMILAEGEINRFRNAENLKSQFLNNGMTVTYHQRQSGEETNYINYDILCGKSDIKRCKTMEESFDNSFPPMDFTNLQMSGVINVSPENLDDDSFWSNLDLTAFFYKIIGFDPISVKWMLQIPADMTIIKGAKYCIANPSKCENLPKVDLLTGVAGMGHEFQDWATTVIIMKGVTATAVLALDSLPKVVDAVTNASVGSNNSFGKGVKTGLKFIVGLSSKVIKVAVYALDSLLSVFLPLAYLMFCIGVFVVYVIPALKVFSVISMILSVVYSLITFLVFTLIINAIKSIWLGRRDANAARNDSIKTLVGHCSYIPIYMFFVFLSNYMNTTIDISGVGRQLVSHGDESVVAGIMGLMQLFAYAIYVVVINISSIAFNAEKTMKAAFGFTTGMQRDALSKQAMSSYQNQAAIKEFANLNREAQTLGQSLARKFQENQGFRKPAKTQDTNFS